MKKFILGTVLGVLGQSAFSASYQCVDYKLYTTNPLENPETLILSTNEETGELLSSIDSSEGELSFTVGKSKEALISNLVSELAKVNGIAEKDKALLSENLFEAFSEIEINGHYTGQNKTLGFLNCTAI